MITAAIIITFFGFFFCYSTSKRAVYQNSIKLQAYLKDSYTKGNTLGVALLIVGLIVSIAALGWGAGIFSYLVILMTLGSHIIILTPLRFFSKYTLVAVSILSFIIELSIS